MSLDVIEYGRMLRNIRTEAGITSEELAKRARISTVQNVTKFEAGRVQRPAYETIERLSKAICELDIIKGGDFRFEDYSKESVATLNMFRNEGRVSTEDKPDDSPAEWQDMSQQDKDMAVTLIMVMNEYPDFKRKLRILQAEVEKNFNDPKDVNFCDILHDLTARKHMGFYKETNNMFNDMVKNKNCYHAYKFLSMIVHTLNMSMDDYGDKDPYPPEQMDKFREVERKGNSKLLERNANKQ